MTTALRPQEKALLDHVATLSDEVLLTILPWLSNTELDLIAEDFEPGGFGCGCELVPLPCECGYVNYGKARTWRCGDREVGDLRGVHRVQKSREKKAPKWRDAITEMPQVCRVCGMEPDYAPCRHYRIKPRSDAVLQAIHAILNREPPLPALPRKSLRRDARCNILAERYDRGEALWHPDDDVYIHPHDDQILDRAQDRVAWTRDGWNRAGQPKEIGPPPKNGDVVIGPFKQRAA